MVSSYSNAEPSAKYFISSSIEVYLKYEITLNGMLRWKVSQMDTKQLVSKHKCATFEGKTKAMDSLSLPITPAQFWGDGGSALTTPGRREVLGSSLMKWFCRWPGSPGRGSAALLCHQERSLGRYELVHERTVQPLLWLHSPVTVSCHKTASQSLTTIQCFAVILLLQQDH